jgi:hypothetical protein
MSPQIVEECVRSVMADNPEYSEERAYSICVAMQNRNELEVSDDPTHDELLTAAASQDIDCPEGHVHTGSTCVPIEEVRDVPPSLLNSSPVLQLADLETKPIEREELGENEVAYRHVKILQAGTWTDSNSRETIWYSPEGLSNMQLTEDNAVNIMHDSGNEISEVGRMENLQEEDGSLFADLILDTSSNAGGYADENFQQTLETEGAEGFGGPSVEIPADGQQVKLNKEKGVKELVAGKIDGLGLVKNPASKPVSFARQTAQRGVALSDGEQTVMKLESERSLMDPEEAREILEKFGFDTGDMDDEDVVDMLKDMHEEMMDYVEEGESEGDSKMGDYEDNEEEDDEENEMQEGEEEEEDDMPEEEEEEMDMESKIQSLEERLSNLEDMAESAMMEGELSEELEEATQDLADAETVQELEEAKEELDKRLSELEERPENPRSLSDNSEEEETEAKSVTPVAERDGIDGTIRR